MRKLLAIRRNKPAPAPILAVEVNGQWRYYERDKACEPHDAKRRALVRVTSFDHAAPAPRGRRAISDVGKRLTRAKPAWVRYGNWACFTPQQTRSVQGYAATAASALLFDRLSSQESGVLLQWPLVEDFHALAVYKRNRELTGWTVVRDADVEPTSARLGQEAGLADAPLIVLPGIVEVLDAATVPKPYPLEPEWNGVKLRHLRVAAAALALALGVGGLADWASAQRTLNAAMTLKRSASQRLSRTRSRAIAWNRQHVRFIAHAHSLNVSALLSSAAAVDVPGGRVALDRNGRRLITYLPLETFPNLTPGRWTASALIRAGLAHKPPEGWGLQGLMRTGASGGYALVYRRR